MSDGLRSALAASFACRASLWRGPRRRGCCGARASGKREMKVEKDYGLNTPLGRSLMARSLKGPTINHLYDRIRGAQSTAARSCDADPWAALDDRPPFMFTADIFGCALPAFRARYNARHEILSSVHPNLVVLAICIILRQERRRRRGRIGSVSGSDALGSSCLDREFGDRALAFANLCWSGRFPSCNRQLPTK
jgi:hypothetical protein